MSSRYDPLDETKPPVRSPLEPVPKAKTQIAAVIAIVLASAVGVGAAFGFDVCALLHSVGLELDACKVAPAPGTGGDAPAPAALPAVDASEPAQP